MVQDKVIACEALSRLAAGLHIPLIASGGAGCLQDFYDALVLGQADAVLAAGVFHSGKITIPEVKAFLSGKNIIVR